MKFDMELIWMKIYEPIWMKICEIGSVFISTLSAIIVGILASFVIYTKSTHYHYPDFCRIKNILESEQFFCDIIQFISLLLIVPLLISLSIHLSKSENLYQKIKSQSKTEQSFWVYNNSISEQVGSKIMMLIILFGIFVSFILYELICVR